jgi:exo-beta-1,3-glucanase (GH17 family)
VGQNPDLGRYPSPEQVLEDLRILEKNWKFIRIYSADRHGEDVLQTIRREKLSLKVMLGVWLNGKPEKLNSNSLQIVRAIRLANEYPEIVSAVNVGNEILVSWSDHRLTEAQALAYVAQVKAAVRCPVTVADDSLYWRDPAAKLVEAVDFITVHAYPLWNGEDIDTALASTIRTYEAVRDAHPDKTIVIGEAGWATFTDSPKTAPSAGSEAKQLRYYQELNAWAKSAGVTLFIFEAFDEPWKGSGTEGHWGVFNEARKAKAAMREAYPERSAEPSPGQSSNAQSSP